MSLSSPCCRSREIRLIHTPLWLSYSSSFPMTPVCSFLVDGLSSHSDLFPERVDLLLMRKNVGCPWHPKSLEFPSHSFVLLQTPQLSFSKYIGHEEGTALSFCLSAGGSVASDIDYLRPFPDRRCQCSVQTGKTAIALILSPRIRRLLDYKAGVICAAFR